MDEKAWDKHKKKLEEELANHGPYLRSDELVLVALEAINLVINKHTTKPSEVAIIGQLIKDRADAESNVGIVRQALNL